MQRRDEIFLDPLQVRLLSLVLAASMVVTSHLGVSSWVIHDQQPGRSHHSTWREKNSSLPVVTKFTRDCKCNWPNLSLIRPSANQVVSSITCIPEDVHLRYVSRIFMLVSVQSFHRVGYSSLPQPRLQGMVYLLVPFAVNMQALPCFELI